MKLRINENRSIPYLYYFNIPDDSKSLLSISSDVYNTAITSPQIKGGNLPQPTGQGGERIVIIDILAAGEAVFELGNARVTDKISWTDEGILRFIPFYELFF